MKIGTIGGKADVPVVAPGVASNAEPIKEDAEQAQEEEDTTVRTLSCGRGCDAEARRQYFGDLVPFGDPAWYQDWGSPY